MKTFFCGIIFFYFFLCSTPLIAQKEAYSDISTTLQHLQNENLSDSAKAVYYTALSSLYAVKNLDSAFLWGEKAIELSKQKNIQPVLANAYIEQGTNYLSAKNFDAASSLFKDAIDLSRSQHYYNSLYTAFNRVSYMCQLNEIWDKALQYAKSALDICATNSQQCTESHAYAYMNFGRVYAALNNYDTAESYYANAKNGFNENRNDEQLANCYLEMAGMYTHQKKYTAAKQLLDSAAYLFNLLNEPLKTAKVYEGYGNLNLSQSLYDYSKLYFGKSYKIYNDNRRVPDVQKLKISFGRIAFSQHLFILAQHYFDSAYIFFKNTSDDKTKLEALSLLNRTDSVLAISWNSDKYSYQYRLISDSLKSRRDRLLTSELMTDSFIEKTYTETAPQKEENEPQNMNAGVLVVAGITLLAMSILFAILYRQKNAALKEVEKMQQKTAATNKELAKINTIKDKLISIMGHDIRSPLASLQNTLALTRENILSKNEFEKYSLSVEEDIYNLRGMLDNMLLWAREQLVDIQINKVNFNLSQLVEEIIKLNKNHIASKNFSVLNYLVPDTEVFSDKDIVNTVFRNLFSNALKFSQPGKKIYLQQIHANNKVYISIKDEGDGMAPEILKKLNNTEFVSTRGTANEKGTGLGILFSKELLNKLGETFDMTSIPGKGTSVTFSLSIQ
ncbi:MAG: ATP-binding protein [Parafilimonas sp.]